MPALNKKIQYSETEKEFLAVPGLSNSDRDLLANGIAFAHAKEKKAQSA